MTDREALHRLIERLPDSELARARNILEEASPASDSALPEPTGTDFASLHRMAEEVYANVPQEEWDRLPDDLVEHVDHYIYGLPKPKIG